MGGWPWPLDAVQGWFESFWSSILEGVAFIADLVEAQLAVVVQALGAAIAAAQSAILGTLDTLGAALDGAFSSIAGAISNAVGAFVSQIVDAFSTFFNVIGQVLGAIGNAIADAVSSAFDVLVNALQGFVDAVVSAAAAAADVIVKGLEAIWSFLVDQVAPAVASAVTAALGWVNDALSSAKDTILNLILDAAPRSPEPGIEAAIAVAGAVGITGLSIHLATTIAEAAHPIHRFNATNLGIWIMESTGAARIPAETFGTIWQVALGIPLRQELNAMFRREIPGVADLVRFLTREAFLPGEAVERQVEEFGRWMALQGFADRWQTSFWHAHWRIPSRQEAVEMFHRGLIDLQGVQDLLVLNDIMPEWVDPLMALTFRTPSRAELERIVEVEDVPEERLVAWLKADGISDELIPTYLALVRGRRLIRIHTRVETLVRRGLRDGFLQEEAFRGIMKDFRFSPAVIDAELKLAKLDYNLDFQEDLVRMWVEAFRKGEVTAEELLTELVALGMVEDRAGLLVYREQLRKLPKPKVVA
jgi:hypothetical protein